MSRIPKNTHLLVGIIVCLGALLALVTILYSDRSQPGKTTGGPAAAPVKESLKPESPTGANGQILLWETIVVQLRNANAPTVAQAQLRQIRDELQTLNRAEASARIQDFLDTKEDATTHLSFKIGADGSLTESPSLRVFLLDYLAQIDPAAAANYAKVILATKDSPEEWAIALRNLARFSHASEQAFLSQKVQELLTHEPWVKQPSAGFLEAFDVAVHLGGTNQLAVLTDLVRRKENQPVAQAAYLALDRLIITEATTTLAFLENHSNLMQGREETRANYFARADVRESPQRQVLENYLLNPDLTTAEVDRFAGLYPNANFMVSHNLLTPVVTPDAGWLKSRDAEALRVVQQWEADPRFAHLQPQLATIRQRLEVFVRQAANSQ